MCVSVSTNMQNQFVRKERITTSILFCSFSFKEVRRKYIFEGIRLTDFAIIIIIIVIILHIAHNNCLQLGLA